MAKKKYLRLRTHGRADETAYLVLRDHPHEAERGVAAKTVDIHALIENDNGPRLSLDLDKLNRPIGIEILYPSEGEEDAAGGS